jgi:hypothetical protein
VWLRLLSPRSWLVLLSVMRIGVRGEFHMRRVLSCVLLVLQLERSHSIGFLLLLLASEAGQVLCA